METQIVIQQSTRAEQLVFLYEKAFPQVAALVQRSGGNLDDAKDVFHDALMVLYEQNAAMVLTNGPAYVTGIAKHLWYKKSRAANRETALANDPQFHLPEENDPPVSKSLLRLVEHSGKRCLELLKSVYYDRLNMQELAARFGLSGERSAATQKYKCLEKVRDAVKQRALTKDDFYE